MKIAINENLELRLFDSSYASSYFESIRSSDINGEAFFEGKIAGVFEFHPMSVENFVEVGFWLFPGFRGKGILAQAFPRMIEYAAKNFTKEKMVATTAVTNEPAQKLLERSGFKKIGEVEEPLKDGTIERQYLYELMLPKVAS